ncbi:hypothetical protein WJX73_009706 [Symbiochloris irregularis]|uniref:Uncharacterized protein n=1 Tax=Symbiochloris irregularis TaxID=706552 RepID=A0AAW1NWQ4_9CHLO
MLTHTVWSIDPRALLLASLFVADLDQSLALASELAPLEPLEAPTSPSADAQHMELRLKRERRKDPAAKITLAKSASRESYDILQDSLEARGLSFEGGPGQEFAEVTYQNDASWPHRGVSGFVAEEVTLELLHLTDADWSTGRVTQLLVKAASPQVQLLHRQREPDYAWTPIKTVSRRTGPAVVLEVAYQHERKPELEAKAQEWAEMEGVQAVMMVKLEPEEATPKTCPRSGQGLEDYQLRIPWSSFFDKLDDVPPKSVGECFVLDLHSMRRNCQSICRRGARG